ncbi:MAG: hypothetical protein ACSHX7_03655, partial [Luteolibacter sp.]
MRSENGKKATKCEADDENSVKFAHTNSLTTFQKRLSDFCSQNSNIARLGSGERSHAEAQHLLVVAVELGLLTESEYSWAEFSNLDVAFRQGSEHVVEFHTKAGLVGKTTIPPAFGLTPFLNQIKTVSADPTLPSSCREAIEFRSAT